MLSVQALTAGYGRVTVLRDVSLQVDQGEILAILGSNGAGKSTLLKTVAGLLRPRSGTISAEGQEIGGNAAEDVSARGIVLVPEGRQLFGEMTVQENLILGAYQHRRRKALIREEMSRVLELFPILQTRLRQRADSLSGGQQQMVAIGRGLMARPKLLMLDEPSLGLAPKVIESVFEALDQLRKSGLTILVVEQNAIRTLALADRCYVLERGRVAVSGSANELASDPRIREAYLGLQVTMAQ